MLMYSPNRKSNAQTKTNFDKNITSQTEKNVKNRKIAPSRLFNEETILLFNLKVKKVSISSAIDEKRIVEKLLAETISV